MTIYLPFTLALYLAKPVFFVGDTVKLKDYPQCNFHIYHYGYSYYTYKVTYKGMLVCNKVRQTDNKCFTNKHYCSTLIEELLERNL